MPKRKFSPSPEPWGSLREIIYAKKTGEVVARIGTAHYESNRSLVGSALKLYEALRALERSCKLAEDHPDRMAAREALKEARGEK